MIRLGIRVYDAHTAFVDWLSAESRSQELAIRHSIPSSTAVLEAFFTDQGFCVLIDLRSWLECSVEGVSGLALGYLSDDEVRAFFYHGQPSCELRFPDGQKILLNKNQPANKETVIEHVLPEVNTDLGKGWLLNVPADISALLKRNKTFEALYIPFRLILMLGESFLSYKYIKKLQEGDVLLVSELKEQVQVDGFTLGNYIHEEGKLMFEQNNENINFENDGSTDFPECSSSMKPQITGLDRMPVKIEFILAELTMKLSELKNLSQGDVIHMMTQGKNSVMVRANSALIGKGELVWIDENLCVEIQTLYTEQNNGK